MSDLTDYPLAIRRGSTFSRVFWWEQPRLAYRQIQAATQAAPCVLTTATDHDLPDGWLIKIEGCKGMTELNARAFDEDPEKRFYRATVLGDDTIELNDVNAAGFKAYTGGGIISYGIPVDLAGFTAAAHIRATADSSEILLEMSTENGRIVLDNTAKTITLQISAVDTAAIDWTTGVYDLELTSSGGIVTAIAAGRVKVEKDVTRDE